MTSLIIAASLVALASQQPSPKPLRFPEGQARCSWPDPVDSSTAVGVVWRGDLPLTLPEIASPLHYQANRLVLRRDERAHGAGFVTIGSPGALPAFSPPLQATPVFRLQSGQIFRGQEAVEVVGKR